MLRASLRKNRPRRCDALPADAETASFQPIASMRPRRGIDLDLPRVLSAGTFAIAVASAAVLMLGGCASFGHQSAPVAQRAAESVGLQAGVHTTAVDAQWWRQFGDARLNDLVAQGLAGSPSLGMAAARVTQARAVVEATRGSEDPQIGFSASVDRSRLSGHGLFPPPYAGMVSNNPDARFTLNWDADFFGRQRADLEAALGSARAVQADADVAAQQIATQVVRAYFSLARLDSQRLVAQRTLDQRTHMLSLIRQRVSAGLDTVVELRQGEGALPETRGQIEALDEQIDLVRHQLAALTAQPPQSLATLAPTLDGLHVSPQPPVLGADLLARRPEIAAALARVEAAGQQVVAQRAQFYPDINFSADVGLSSLKFGNFTDWASRTWAFGPALHLPIFEGGQLRARLKGRGADRDAAIEAYNQQVIDAVREAADAATSLASVGRQQIEERQALDAAQSSYQYSQDRYAQGLGNQLVVLNAETLMLTQRRLDVDLQYRALDAQAQLMKALGGGWESAPSAAAATVGVPAAVPASTPAATAARNDTVKPA